MTTVEQGILERTALRIEDMADDIEGLIEWAEAEGYPAIAHKLQEAWGKVNSAAGAANQYTEGLLERRQ